MSPAGIRTRPGRPYPLGATWDGAGVNFALFSEHATGVELCLFDAGNPGRETHRIPIRERTDQIWHVYLPEARPELLYGYRVDGPWQPRAGHRFNPAKVLIDPYAKAIAGAVSWNDAMFGHKVGVPDGEMVRDERDNAPYLPKSAVIDPAFTWGDDRPPRTPWHRTVIYEAARARVYRAASPTSRNNARQLCRTRLAGRASSICKRLGITAVEFLPVHHFIRDKHLRRSRSHQLLGLQLDRLLRPGRSVFRSAGRARGPGLPSSRRWSRRSTRRASRSSWTWSTTTPEKGNHLGPTLSFRGIDNASYYRLVPEDQRRYYRTTPAAATP